MEVYQIMEKKKKKSPVDPRRAMSVNGLKKIFGRGQNALCHHDLLFHPYCFEQLLPREL